MARSVAELVTDRGAEYTGYTYAFLDEMAKREIRRSLLKAVAIPGYQIPFGSREMPIARGWGTGGLQITLGLVGPGDTVKVIDQGDDAGVNASNIRRLIERTTGVPTTLATDRATIIQTRHRIPEQKLREDQILVLQCPNPEPLRAVERSMAAARIMHAEKDYSQMWLALYEDIVRRGEVSYGAGYPVMVNHRYVMATTPIPRWDVPQLHMAPCLFLFGAGREKRLYAVPPHTHVEPLAFDDYPFEVESFAGKLCARCGAADTFLTEIPRDVEDPARAGNGSTIYLCSDTAYCDLRLGGGEAVRW